MLDAGSFGITRVRSGLEHYLHPPLRSRHVWFGFFVVIVLLAMAFAIVVKNWSRLSVFAIGWIAFSMIWVILLFRSVLRSHQSLQMMLAMRRIDRMDNESPLGEVLGMTGDFSNMALLSSFWSVLALLMAIGTILVPR
jgi:hypothetical protein